VSAEAETEELVSETEGELESPEAVEAPLEDTGQAETDGATASQESGAAGQEEEDPWAEALAEQLQEESDGGATGADDVGESYSPAPLDPLESDTSGGDRKEVDLDLVLDIPVTIAMEIGRTQINIRNLLQLNQGSVVELDRLAGEPLDVMVNGTLIAHGEVVVVNEKFGIRLTDVVSAQERLRNLKK